MTALEIISKIRSAHPEMRLAVSAKGTEIGLWEREYGFYPYIAQTIVGGWVWVARDYLVNGQKIERNWKEVV